MSRIVEMIRGTPQERRDIEYSTRLKNKPRLTKSEKNALERGKSISRRVFLRQAAAASGLGIFALAGGKVFLPENTSEKNSYHGPIGDMEGEPLIERERLSDILNALKGTGFPLLEKVSNELARLTSITDNPAEFPKWVSENSTPMAITVGTDMASKAVSQIDWGDPSVADFYTIGKSGQPVGGKVPLSTVLGIHLAIPKILAERGPLVQGLYLTKEYITHMLSLKMQQEWWKVNEQFGFVQFTRPNGQPITDPVEQQSAGFGYFLREILDPLSPIERTLDAFPVLLLGQAMRYLDQQGIVDHNNHQGIGGIVTAANLLEKDKREKGGFVFDQTDSLISQWISADTLLPPDGITESILTEPMAPSILKLAEFMSSQTQGVPGN